MSTRNSSTSGRGPPAPAARAPPPPKTGTTKGELLDYYSRIADAMLPHLRDRQLHMHRYPEGVEGPRFWQKECPEHRPEWVQTAPVWSRDKNAEISYCVVDELATL